MVFGETPVRRGRRECEGSKAFRVHKVQVVREENRDSRGSAANEATPRPSPVRRVLPEDWALPVQDLQGPRDKWV